MRPITLFCFIIICISCSKEETLLNRENLVGVWYEEDYPEEVSRISRLEYHFKEDHTIEILRIEIEQDSGEILGYRYRSYGNYKLENDQLSFYNLVSYCNDDTKGSYTEIENLKLVNENEGDSFTVTCKLEKNGQSLIFIYPPCGELANCIGSKTLIKE